MSKETVGTIGEQKMNNYALRSDMTKEEFVKEVTNGLTSPPAYFPLNVGLNKKGYEDIEVILEKGQKGMSPCEFEHTANQTGAVVLDVRHQKDFAKAHIPNSIFIGINGGFAPWVGALIKDVKQPILLLTPEGKLEETITRLSRVGFDNVIGYLEGGIKGWIEAKKETECIKTITAEEFSKYYSSKKIKVLDVRKKSEYLTERVIGATNTPLDSINEYLKLFSQEEVNYVYCAGGYRSIIAESILKLRGIHNLIDVQGGFDAIKKTNLNVSDYVCPSTL
jgi:rhodanese-related sulfurtransferase